jgi:hypothetical protein
MRCTCLYQPCFIFRRHVPDPSWSDVPLRYTRDALLFQAAVVDPRSVTVPLERCILDIRPELALCHEFFAQYWGGLAAAVFPRPTSRWVVRVVTPKHLIDWTFNSVRDAIADQHMRVRIALAA